MTPGWALASSGTPCLDSSTVAGGAQRGSASWAERARSRAAPWSSSLSALTSLKEKGQGATVQRGLGTWVECRAGLRPATSSSSLKIADGLLTPVEASSFTSAHEPFFQNQGAPERGAGGKHSQSLALPSWPQGSCRGEGRQPRGWAGWTSKPGTPEPARQGLQTVPGWAPIPGPSKSVLVRNVTSESLTSPCPALVTE